MPTLSLRARSLLVRYIAMFAGVTLLVRAASWLGFEVYSVTVILLGLAICAGVDFWFLPSDRRRAMVSSIAKFGKAYGGSILRYGVGGCIGVLLYLSHEPPTNPLLFQVYKLVELGGLILIMMVPVYRSVQSALMGIAYRWMASTALAIFEAWLVLSALLYVIATQGPHVRVFAEQHPEASIAMLLALLPLALIAVPLFVTRNYSEPVAEGSFADAKLACSVPLSDQDLAYIAAHEAGHALVYAALGAIPPNLRVEVKSDACPTFQSMGSISFVQSRHRLESRTLVEWRMLVYLAGQQAEVFVLGQSSLGAAQDHARWLECAKGLSVQSLQRRFLRHAGNFI